MKAITHREKRSKSRIPWKEYASKRQKPEEIKVTRPHEAIEKTLAEIHKHLSDTYIESKYLEGCIQKLKTNGIVTLSGKCGSGKTWHGLELLYLVQNHKVFTENHISIRLESLDNWERFVHIGGNVILLLDNVLGTFHVDKSNIRKNIQHLQKICEYLRFGKLSIITTVRSEILREFKRELECCRLFYEENITEIDPYDEIQTEDEKRRILDTYFRHYDVVVSGKEHARDHLVISTKTYDKILDANPSLGFLQCCQLFVRNRHFFNTGAEFFLDPVFYISEELKMAARSRSRIHRVAFIILVYIMLNGGTVKLRNITAKMIQLLTDEFDSNPVKEETVREGLTYVLGVYINKMATGLVSFQHDVIIGLVLKIYGDLQPVRLIQLCRTNILCEYMFIDNYDTITGDTDFKVPQMVWDEWIIRSLNDIRHGKTSQVVSHRSFFYNPFVLFFVSELLSSTYSKLTEDIFLTSCKEDSYFLLRILLRFILKKKSSKLRHIVSKELLVMDGLRQACYHDSSNSVRVILDQFQDIRHRSMSKCFHIACSHGNVSTVEVFLRQRKDLTKENLTKGLINACRCPESPYGAYGELTVQVILRNRRDLSFESISQGLTETCKLGRYGTARMILQERRDLPHKFVTKGLVEASKCERNCPGSDGFKCLEVIISSRADLQNHDATQALIGACGTTNSEKVKLILKSWSDLSASSIEKGLIEASCRGSSKSIELLLNYRKDLARDHVLQGLRHACKYGRSDAVQTILSLRPDLSLDDVKEGLIEACLSGQNSTVKLILHLKMDLSADQVAEGLSAACKTGERETVHIILNKRKNLTASHLSFGIMTACISNHTEIVKEIIRLRPELTTDIIRDCLMNVKEHDYIMICECVDIILQQKEI